MEHVKYLECTLCGSKYPPSPDRTTCLECGEEGILDVVYDYDLIARATSKETMARDGDSTMWRYRAFLPVERGEPGSTLAVGGTPLYRATSLGARLGLRCLYVKDDGQNPTGSLKDRASALAVVKAREAGADTLACSSTGNAASSLAGNTAFNGLRAVIFVPARVPEAKLAQMLMYGAMVVKVNGSYHETYALSAQAIARWGWYNRNAAVNPYLVEGKKTVSIEACEQMGWKVPDWVAVSVGDGCTLFGVYKGFFDLYRAGITDGMPRILGVQAEGCCPITRAFEKGSEKVIPEEERTMADSIAVGAPRNPVKALRAVRRSGGLMVNVADEDIYHAARLLGQTTGVFAEPAGAAGLAGLIKTVSRGYIGKGDTVLVLVTGNGLKDGRNAIRAAPAPLSVEPDIDQLASVLSHAISEWGGM